MKLAATARLLVPSVLLALLLVAGCDTAGDSLYDPDRPALPTPEVTDVTPMDTVGAVVPITITGRDFAASLDSNLVYFGGRRAYVAEASPTELTVYAPDVSGAEDLPVKLTTLGARFYSSETPYRLHPAARGYGGLSDRQTPYALAADDDGTLYVNLFEGGVPAGLFRIPPEGEPELITENGFPWSAYEVGPEGGILGVRGVRAVFRFPAEGGPREVWQAIDGGGSLVALDVDGAGNVWTGGRSPGLFRITQEKDVYQFPFEPAVRAIERLGDQLYVLALDPDTDGTVLWRFPVAADATLEAGEVVFRLSDQVRRPGRDAGVQGFALAAAADGTLFIGVDGPDPLVTWHPERGHEVLFPDAAPTPDVAGLQGDARFLAWGPAPYLYYTQGGTDSDDPDFVPQIMRVNTLTYRGAD